MSVWSECVELVYGVCGVSVWELVCGVCGVSVWSMWSVWSEYVE